MRSAVVVQPVKYEQVGAGALRRMLPCGTPSRAGRCVTGVATSSHVDEAKALVAKSLDGEHHQGSGMTATLVIRVHGNHLDNAERFVLVLL